MLALVQTATTLPGLLLGLPAGALADVIDRRRLLVAASGWMLAVGAILAIATIAHLTSSWVAARADLRRGVGGVLALPAWQAITPEVVPAGELQSAVTLSSVAVNLACAVGPAAGGLAVALAGPAAAFLLTVACSAGGGGAAGRLARLGHISSRRTRPCPKVGPSCGQLRR
jgi:MFS family permease